MSCTILICNLQLLRQQHILPIENNKRLRVMPVPEQALPVKVLTGRGARGPGNQPGPALLHPSCQIEHLQRTLSSTQDGERLRLTPPPEEVVPAEVLAGAARRAELVADRLGLAGLASVDAFMNADTAELIVLEADVTPSFAPAADLLQQVRSAVGELEIDSGNGASIW